MRYQRVYPQGLPGKRALNVLPTGEHLCPLQPGIPWQDLLPKGAMNFWTGSQACPPNKYVLRVEVSPNGTMKVDGCPSHESLSYVPFPDTKTWNTSSKDLFQINKEVLAQLKEIPYGPSAQLPPDCESFLVQCGSATRQLFFRKTQRQASSPSPSLKASPQQYNILVLFIDAVSHRHFYRKLPLTAEVLFQMTKKSGFSLHEYFRYSLTGFNTDPNTLALYTGHLWDEGETSHRHEPLWEGLRRNGYVTAWMNDDCDDWSVSCMKRTTSYALSHELLAPFCHPEYYPAVGHPFGNFKGPYSIRRRCLFGHYVHHHAFAWVNHMVSLYHKKQPFAFFNAFIEGHEGSGEVLSTMDAELADFLKKASDSGLFEDTVLLLLSDHGNHMSLSYVYTENGRQEHESPFLFVSVPDSLAAAADVDDPSRTVGQNLERNEQVLVNAFDIHFFLKVLIQWQDRENLHGDAQGWWRQSLLSNKRANRTCEEAKVPDNFCWCHHPNSMPT
ncbi:hypothetical protein CBR_g49366 [Chara braunii]|uniref:Sulfatase N-terminal domain-containing protein n=1 Tax=Chara braunii TaxID=69332 RepID=A0A388M4R9_CHABU|nr:hypothetical protein CBR_g49366 [Chara braunii]|eukprot:GBG89577.1 hypothetical protein CBR_g49366 [Chara braunii]